MAPPMSRIAPLSALLGLSAVLTGHALRTSQSAASDVHKAASRNLHAYTFRDFVAEFSRTYEEGTEQWAMRKELFTESLKDAVEFNSKPGRSWQKGVTKFMDYTEAERKRVLGYTGRGSRQHTGVPANAVAFASGRAMDLPSEFSVERPGTKLINIVREQGNCGSCWAEAATATLEGQLEANETIMAALGRMHAKSSSQVPEVPTLSSQMIVSCTPNPRNCGGTGGCGGATVELAYDMIKGNAGLPFAVEWGYESGNSGQAPACKKDLFPKAQVAITGYNALPSNRLLPLQEALVKSGGPVAVSVDATNWFVYAGGIFSDLDFGGKGDFTVNHAVTLVGYKEPEDGASGYWVIKNSWGPYWGESGKIRLEMKEDEGNHCGWDRKTHDGVACDGDPDQAWVCGTCGILYDSVYPTGVHLKTA